jgi:hypothetical protein
MDDRPEPVDIVDIELKSYTGNKRLAPKQEQLHGRIVRSRHEIEQLVQLSPQARPIEYDQHAFANPLHDQRSFANAHTQLFALRQGRNIVFHRALELVDGYLAH